jgi:hypothetical protein
MPGYGGSASSWLHGISFFLRPESIFKPVEFEYHYKSHPGFHDDTIKCEVFFRQPVSFNAVLAVVSEHVFNRYIPGQARHGIGTLVMLFKCKRITNVDAQAIIRQ